jgi:hypothetical protein
MIDERSRMITGSQIRGARAMLAWDVRTLAERAGISEATIRRGEATDRVPTMRSDNLAALQRTMEVAGIVFLDEGDVRTGGPGVRLRRRP